VLLGIVTKKVPQLIAYMPSNYVFAATLHSIIFFFWGRCLFLLFCMSVQNTSAIHGGFSNVL